MSPRPHFSLLLVCVACLPEVMAPPEPPRLLGLEPLRPLAVDEPLYLVFSRSLRPADPVSALRVLRNDGRVVPIEPLDVEPSDRWSIRPREAWPEAEWLTIEFGEGLTDEVGQPFPPPDVVLRFETRGASPAARVDLRMPRASEPWPLNLRYAALSVVPSELDEVRAWLLGPGEARWPLDTIARDEGRLLVRLPDHEGDCRPLCPAALHRLVLESGGLEYEGPEISTTTVADRLAPILMPREPVRRGANFYVDVESSEPVVFDAWAASTTGHVVRLRPPIVPALSSRLQTELPLAPESTYRIEVRAEDLAGNRAEDLSFEVETPSAPEIEISELVLAPLHDWGDSEAAGAPFDAQPGTGTVSDIDQWVELVNRSRHPIDLHGSGLILRALDQTPTETWLENALVLYFGSGGDPSWWWPGEALVLRLRGQMSKTELVLELLHGSVPLDRLEIGRTESADHVGGRAPDLEHEAVAKDALGRFRFCVPTPGDPAPAERCLAW